MCPSIGTAKRQSLRLFVAERVTKIRPSFEQLRPRIYRPCPEMAVTGFSTMGRLTVPPSSHPLARRPRSNCYSQGLYRVRRTVSISPGLLRTNETDVRVFVFVRTITPSIIICSFPKTKRRVVVVPFYPPSRRVNSFRPITSVTVRRLLLNMAETTDGSYRSVTRITRRERFKKRRDVIN